MHYIPEISPLLDRSKYDISVSFILSDLFNELAASGRSVTHHVEVEVYLNGADEPLVIPFDFPAVKGNKNYGLSLNDALKTRGVPPDREGFFVIKNTPVSETPLPSVLKTIGHWVAYVNDKTYVVTPSNVLFASARLDYGSAKAARLLDYFGLVISNDTCDTHVPIINPYVGESRVDLTFFADGAESIEEHLIIPPFSTHWVRLSEILAKRGKKQFRGNAKLVASHRVVPFFFFYDNAEKMYYSADHTISWVNRQTIR